jgi:hypothetical protein
VGYFFIGKQKVILFPTFRENRWEGKGREAARNALTTVIGRYKSLLRPLMLRCQMPWCM